MSEAQQYNTNLRRTRLLIAATLIDSGVIRELEAPNPITGVPVVKVDLTCLKKVADGMALAKTISSPNDKSWRKRHDQG